MDISQSDWQVSQTVLLYIRRLASKLYCRWPEVIKILYFYSRPIDKTCGVVFLPLYRCLCFKNKNASNFTFFTRSIFKLHRTAISHETVHHSSNYN